MTSTGPGEIGGSDAKSAPPLLKPQTVCLGNWGWMLTLAFAPMTVWKNTFGWNRSRDWCGSVLPSKGRLVAGFVARLGSLVGAGG